MLQFVRVPLPGPVGGVEEVPPFQPQVYTYVCDVGKRESVYSTAEKVRREVGEVDILINNAGVVSGHHLLECPDELIERTMVVNCHAHFWVSSVTNERNDSVMMKHVTRFIFIIFLLQNQCPLFPFWRFLKSVLKWHLQFHYVTLKFCPLYL